MKTRKLTPLGAAIKKALIDKNMTQVQLAETVGVDAKYINLILYGDRSGAKYLDEIVSILELEDKSQRRRAI